MNEKNCGYSTLSYVIGKLTMLLLINSDSLFKLQIDTVQNSWFVVYFRTYCNFGTCVSNA